MPILGVPVSPKPEKNSALTNAAPPGQKTARASAFIQVVRAGKWWGVWLSARFFNLGGLGGADPPGLLDPALPVSVIRVLLVDDHAVLRQGLCSIVTGYGHLRVSGEARDGLEAVALAHQMSPDVVIMDINMPKMDGIEATRRITTERPDIIVIGLSVNQSPDTELRMKAAGATALLGKESAAETLCEIINKTVFHHRKMSAQKAG